MQWLVPLAFRDLLPTNVWNVLTELSQFFRDLCAFKLHVDDVLRLEKNIVEILCKMERIFPPAFFNVMEHLPVHLPRELKLGGPVQYRWMYDYERYKMIMESNLHKTSYTYGMTSILCFQVSSSFKGKSGKQGPCGIFNLLCIFDGGDY